MGNRLSVDIKEDTDLCYITLSGMIDEDNDLIEVAAKVNQPKVAINTAGVERINSCGVRDWVTWLGELQKKGVKTLYLVECSPVIMAQVNLVHNFVGAGAVVDFYGPYYCATCDANHMLLIEVEEAMRNLPYKAPACRCHRCDLAMEFDDIESSYFAFLNTIQKPGLDLAFLETLRRLSPSTDTKLRARSTSIPSVPTLSLPGPSKATVPLQPAPDVKSFFTDPGAGKEPAAPTSALNTNRVLAIVIALLVASIGLLTFVILRAH
jgi:anti-anti-sigma regulatory factor